MQQIFFMKSQLLHLLIHRPDRSLGENICAIFGCFVKFEVINHTLYSKLNLIDVVLNVQKLKTLYVGDENEKLVSSLRKNKVERETATNFYKKFGTAYVNAIYIQKKYVLNNPLFKSFCALHPW